MFFDEPDFVRMSTEVYIHWTGIEVDMKQWKETDCKKLQQAISAYQEKLSPEEQAERKALFVSFINREMDENTWRNVGQYHICRTVADGEERFTIRKSTQAASAVKVEFSYIFPTEEQPKPHTETSLLFEDIDLSIH